MAVSEGEVGRALMERTGEVAPFEFVEAIHEKTVIERIGMFINKEESIARRDQFAAVEELAIRGIKLIRKLAGVPDEMVHRHTPEARAVIGERDVAGAFVNGGGFADVLTEERFSEECFVGVVGLCAPGLDGIDPVIVLGFGLADSVVVDEAVVSIVGVELPAKGELLDVISTGDGLGFFLRFAESGEKHPGEDRNDRDDNEKLDQREGGIWRVIGS